MATETKEQIHSTTDGEIIFQAERIVREHPEILEIKTGTRDRIAVLLEITLSDPIIRKGFPDPGIRHTSMCGEVAKEVLALIGDDYDQLGVLAIGDVRVPEFVKPALDGIKQRAKNFDDHFKERDGTGYEYTAKGYTEAREAMIGHLDKHYGFPSESMKRTMTRNSFVSAGGLRILDDVVTTMIDKADETSQRARFITPDNSFGTWFLVLKKRTLKSKLADTDTISTNPKDLLHLTPEKVAEYYETHGITAKNLDTWYITPVANPSGTAIAPNTLTETCKTILQYNPEANILLDCVYTRLMEEERSKALLSGVLRNPEIMNRTLLMESISKANALCGSRVGMAFSTNEDLYSRVQSTMMGNTAGIGREKSAMLMAVATQTPEEEAIFRRLYQFWADELHGLYNHLIKSEEFSHLFEDEQAHIRQETLSTPGSIYLMPKIRPGITDIQIAQDAGPLGIKTDLGSGPYVRFSVGKQTTPTYSRYI